ncbi:MAG: hypothetical protein ABL971_14490 [Vicinamibacterales bacterium]
MTDTKLNNELEHRSPDYIAAAAKAALGAVPFAGSLLAELAGSIVPNQRIVRIVDFARRLEQRLSDTERQLIRARLTDEHFSDLLEESVRQAAHSVSEERRERIASLLRNSLNETALSFLESRHLLRILGELNDVEVLRLSSHLFEGFGDGKEFREQHRAILEDIATPFNAPESTYERAAMQGSFDEHLARLGLLNAKHNVNRKTGHLVIDDRTGELEVSGYALLPFGRLFLKQIGVAVDDERANLRMEPTRRP